jgi:hypothetical protein
MTYRIDVDPATIPTAGVATVTVALPDETPQVFDVRLIRRADGVLAGSGTITLDVSATVGPADGTSDYYLDVAGPFTLEQSGPVTFTLTHTP